MSFLGFEGKAFLVFGVANKKSVAYSVARLLEAEGARVICSVRSEERRASVARLLPNARLHVCDVEDPGAIRRLRDDISSHTPKLDGVVHSIAYANYERGFRPFHETDRGDFLQAVQVSCHSLIEIANVFRELLSEQASVVTISISTTRMAAENYGYMAPVKAALDSSVVFLAKSFSAFSRIRFNAVSPGLLKTSASAGIPGYVDSYLFAEQATLRKEGVKTQEVADVVAFLLSHRSSGITAQSIVVDAGMGVNYFDRSLVEKVNRAGLGE